jgi:hypothetical protein
MKYKNILLFFVIIFLSINLFPKGKKNYKTNLSANPDALNLSLSSIYYSQEEKEKKFNAKLQIPMSSELSLDINLSSSEISEGIGPVGFLGLSPKSESHPQSGAKVFVGLSWMNFNKLFKKAEIKWDNDINKKLPDDLAKEVIAISFKTPETLKKFPELAQYYIKNYYLKNEEISELFYNEISRIRTEIEKENRNIDFEKIKGFILEIGNKNFNWNQIEAGVIELGKTLTSAKGRYYLYKIQFAILNENNRDSSEALQQTFAKPETRNFYAGLILFGDSKSAEILEKKDNFIQEEIEKNIIKISLGIGCDYNSIKYLDPYNFFKKENSSYTGVFIAFSGAFFFNSDSIIYLKCDYGRYGKTPESQTIIQEMTEYNDMPITGSSWIQKTAYLEKLGIKKELSPSIYYRNYFTKSFALEPLISMKFSEGKINETKIAAGILFSLDNENNWLLGIQPNITWLRDEESNEMKKSTGVYIYLSKHFKIGKE